MNIYDDERIVMTLDAGGTNFVFAAIQAGKEKVEPFTQPSNGDCLNTCLSGIVAGFEHVKKSLATAPVAISFAFPGPADYKNGVIGDLANLPAFRGGVALGPYLEAHFNIPVYIRNDGDLYTYGEALGGILPSINQELNDKSQTNRYQNLIGVTLGTGLGAGIIQNGTLFSGENGMAGEIWNTPNSISPHQNAEEGISTRAIIRSFESNNNVTEYNLMPADIYEIALDDSHANCAQAKQAFVDFGTHLGDSLTNLILLFDTSIVLGGGIVAAKSFFMPAAMKVLKGQFSNGQNRIIQSLYYYDDPDQKAKLLCNSPRLISAQGHTDKIEYCDSPALFVATSKIGCSQAVALGAYAFALSQLDQAGK